jgi:hypothetical protein
VKRDGRLYLFLYFFPPNGAGLDGSLERETVSSTQSVSSKGHQTKINFIFLLFLNLYISLRDSADIQPDYSYKTHTQELYHRQSKTGYSPSDDSPAAIFSSISSGYINTSDVYVLLAATELLFLYILFIYFYFFWKTGAI